MNFPTLKIKNLHKNDMTRLFNLIFKFFTKMTYKGQMRM